MAKTAGKSNEMHLLVVFRPYEGAFLPQEADEDMDTYLFTTLEEAEEAERKVREEFYSEHSIEVEDEEDEDAVSEAAEEAKSEGFSTFIRTVKVGVTP